MLPSCGSPNATARSWKNAGLARFDEVMNTHGRPLLARAARPRELVSATVGHVPEETSCPHLGMTRIRRSAPGTRSPRSCGISAQPRPRRGRERAGLAVAGHRRHAVDGLWRETARRRPAGIVPADRGTRRVLRAAGLHSSSGSPLAIRRFPLPAPSSLLPAPCSLLPAPCSPAPSLDRSGGRYRPAVPCGRLQSSRLLLLPLPGQGNVAGPVRRPPDRPAAGSAAAMVPAEMDRQGPGPIGEHVARRPRRVPREDPLPADLPGRAEAAAAGQAAGPRRALETIADPPPREAQAMRIGLVLEQFDPARGGREQWTWSFTQRLLELGHEVHVVARSCSAKARRLPIACHPIQCDPSPIAFAGAVRAVLEPLAPGYRPRHGHGLVLRCLPSARRIDGLQRRAQAALPAGMAPRAEADGQPHAAAASHVPDAHAAAVRRPWADRAGPVAGVGRRLPALSRRGPGADPHRLQRRRYRAFLARSNAGRIAQRRGAAWAWRPTP